MGLEKNVCSRNPATASAPPKTAAAIIRGIRMVQMICPAVFSRLCPRRMGHSSSMGTLTLPIRRFSIRSAKSSTPRIPNAKR